jgi:hypothetical protein
MSEEPYLKRGEIGGRPAFARPRNDAPIIPIMRLLDSVASQELLDPALSLERQGRLHFEESIEREIAFIDDLGREVRLQNKFVSHWIAWRKRGEA